MTFPRLLMRLRPLQTALLEHHLRPAVGPTQLAAHHRASIHPRAQLPSLLPSSISSNSNKPWRLLNNPKLPWAGASAKGHRNPHICSRSPPHHHTRHHNSSLHSRQILKTSPYLHNKLALALRPGLDRGPVRAKDPILLPSSTLFVQMPTQH